MRLPSAFRAVGGRSDDLGLAVLAVLAGGKLRFSIGAYDQRGNFGALQKKLGALRDGKGGRLVLVITCHFFFFSRLRMNGPGLHVVQLLAARL